MWIKILDVLLNYGFLGVAAFVLIKNYQKKEQQNQKNFQMLIDNVLSANKENLKELKKSFDDLSINITKLSNSYNLILEDLTDEIRNLREKYIEVSTQLSDMIYDKNKLSHTAFGEVVSRISINISYKILIDCYAVIDQNGFNNEKMVDLLKDNILRILDRRKNEGIVIIKSLNYNQEEINSFIKESEEVYSTFKINIENEIINKINIEDLALDKNYNRLKTLIKNEIFSYTDNIISLVKK